MSSLVYKVETEREADGRWIAEIPDLPGAMAYGVTEREAIASAQAIALRVLADRIEEKKESAETVTVSSGHRHDQEFRFKPQRCYPGGLASSVDRVRGAQGRQRDSWFCFGE